MIFNSWGNVAVDVPIIFLLVFVVSSWMGRIRGGYYKFCTKDGDLIFESKKGKFIFNKDKKLFIANYGTANQITLSFEEIRNIEIVTEFLDSPLGYDPVISAQLNPDFFRTYSIEVITKNFQRIPLIQASQCTNENSPKYRYLNQMIYDVLSLLGVFVPIDPYFQKIYARFKTVLGEVFNFDKYKV